MDKFEVGMYVRTKKGISKIINIGVGYSTHENYPINLYFDDRDNEFYYTDIRENYSLNPIDLIEENDVLEVVYKNEEFVCKVVMFGDTKCVKPSMDLTVSIGLVEIKSILTKEQFKSMEYKIND